ncbi:hypothetical protein PSEUBRA_000896 [Kalmanozyma brasiliensis GHG001]|uniref:uncharacterized protein n=1 Tax=Kalmanozyma brasiliensis (strain GHG001) TaxID=1365824 RepID=UPI001CEB7F67|nr:uncharacterized protein PSEUBRA_000896 [Kalmanozyma brasiliensis GHG001]KAF6766861.1 hypothetical protein PSEUBRA_000896 [Kalmanozyma brasiliensis GHG001]
MRTLCDSLPLTVPRRSAGSAHITIEARNDGVTTFQIRKEGTERSVDCKIDTINEKYLFMVSLTKDIHDKDKDRLHLDDMDLGRAIALLDPPPVDASRTHADHANVKSLDNRGDNLNFVSAVFNNFNRAKQRDSNGFVGVKEIGGSFKVQVMRWFYAGYASAETDALVHNLVCRNTLAD